MSASIEGIPQLKARIKAITPDQRFLKRLALSAVREQKLLAPRRTGNLGRTIQIASLTDTQAEIIARASYAIYVERGTRPHDIRPRNKKALRWKTRGARAQVGGFGFSNIDTLSASRAGSISGVSTGVSRSTKKVRFAKRVRHPGTRAQPFMVPGAQKALEGAELKVTLTTAWDEAA